MSTRTLRSLLPAVFAFAAASPLLTACDQWALVVNGDGLLFVSIINDGDGHGGFRVRAREADGTSRVLDVPPTGNLTLGDLAAGQLELTLLAPAGCRVGEPNPRTLLVNADERVSVAFDVHCSAWSAGPTSRPQSRSPASRPDPGSQS